MFEDLFCQMEQEKKHPYLMEHVIVFSPRMVDSASDKQSQTLRLVGE